MNIKLMYICTFEYYKIVYHKKCTGLFLCIQTLVYLRLLYFLVYFVCTVFGILTYEQNYQLTLQFELSIPFEKLDYWVTHFVRAIL